MTVSKPSRTQGARAPSPAVLGAVAEHPARCTLSFRPARRRAGHPRAGALPMRRCRFLGSLDDSGVAHWDQEPELGATASWTAVTKSAESPLWRPHGPQTLSSSGRAPIVSRESGDCADSIDSIAAVQELAAFGTLRFMGISHNSKNPHCGHELERPVGGVGEIIGVHGPIR